MNIMRNLASACRLDSSAYIQMPVTITVNTNRWIIIPKNQRFLKNKTEIDCRYGQSKIMYKVDISVSYNHKVRYNWTIIDWYDRCVAESITDRNITSNLAICTLQKTLDSQPAIKGELIPHSDQVSQYTRTTKIKSFIYSRRIIVSDTRKKNNGVAVATASFSDVVAGQSGKWRCLLLNIRCTR